ncbi:hypothetical protein [Arthrobacter sp. USHLN218]
MPTTVPDSAAAIGVGALRSGPEALAAATAEYLPLLLEAARRVARDCAL